MSKRKYFVAGWISGGLVSAAIVSVLNRRKYAIRERGLCWPAIPTIAKDLNLSQSTVRRALNDLRKEGLLETEQRYRKSGGKSSLLYTLREQSS